MAFDPVTAALDIGGKLIDRLWPDPADQAKAKVALMDMQQKGELAALAADVTGDTAQAAIDQVEAASASKFVAYWRPTLGWVCVSAFGYNVLVIPVIRTIAGLFGVAVDVPPVAPELNYMLTGMLGLSHVSRSVEKFLGVDTKR